MPKSNNFIIRAKQRRGTLYHPHNETDNTYQWRLPRCHYCSSRISSEDARNFHIAGSERCKAAEALLLALHRKAMDAVVQPQGATNDNGCDRGNARSEGGDMECDESKGRDGDEGEKPRWGGTRSHGQPRDAGGTKPKGEEIRHPPDLATYMRDCGPLGDPTIFEAAELLITTVPTDEGKDRHIKSRLYRGKVPWDRVEGMFGDIDKLPHGASWNVIEIEVHVEGEAVPRIAYLCARDIVEIVAELMGNPRFAKYMKFAPERHWTAEKDGERIYNEMWTGEWWWNIQQLLNEAFGDATVAALIVASDKTQVSTLPGGQQVYPVYVSLGNISKSLRRKASERSTVLLGYLPVEDFDDIDDDDERQRLKGQLIHDAMRELMKPLEVASKDGVEMWCADGRLRRVFPIVASYVADWPEQCLMACTMQSRCPICTIEYDERGASEESPRRKPADTLDALEAYFENGDLRHLNQGPGLKPWWPWWANIPYCDVHASITPDILHQLWLGVFKTHILAWMQWALGKGALDERYMSMPDAQDLRSFSSGVSGIGQWTGRETREMAKQMLCAVAGSVSAEEVELVRTGIEFMTYAELPAMKESDVVEMERLLSEFHELKWIMVDEKDGYYTKESSFDAVPKLHMITHYAASTRLYGTPDGFNSEVPENLHIHYAKKPWRASNKVKPEKQMMLYIQRREAVRIHRSYMDSYCGIVVEDTSAVVVELERGECERGVKLGDLGVGSGVQTITSSDNVLPSRQPQPSQIWYPNPRFTIAKGPTHDKVPCRTLIDEYGAKHVIKLLTKLLATQFDTPAYESLLSPNHLYPVWHRFHLEHPPLPFVTGQPHTDTIRANPAPRNRTGTSIGLGTHDVVLVLDKPTAGGIYRYRAARVRVVFKLPTDYLRDICPDHLAYVELFNPFSSAPSSASSLYSTSHSLRSNGQRQHAIVRVSDIKLACHLAPQYHRLRNWTPGPNRDILGISRHFYLNPHYNHYVFALLENWRRSGVRFKRGVRFAD